MTEDAQPQKSLAGFTGKVAEPGDGFTNPNIGKPLLNDNDEYVLKLVTMPHVVNQKQQKEKKDGTKWIEDQSKAVCEFEEATTKNIVVAFFRVDKLNFSEEDAYRSAVIKFFQKIGHPLTEGVYPDWSQFFIPGMRFRARVVVGMDKTPDGKKTTNGKYYLDVPTCRKLLPSDTAGEDFEKPKPDENGALLGNALLLTKGCKDGQEALARLKAVNATKEVTMAFFNADLEGKVTYPI